MSGRGADRSSEPMDSQTSTVMRRDKNSAAPLARLILQTTPDSLRAEMIGVRLREVIAEQSFAERPLGVRTTKELNFLQKPRNDPAAADASGGMGKRSRQLQMGGESPNSGGER